MPTDFFENLPAGFEAKSAAQVETKTEYLRDAWIVSTGRPRIAAVAHETGIEILIGIGVGVATSVAAAAIIEFSKMAWQRWRDRRTDKLEPSLVLEGRVRVGEDWKIIRTEHRGPLTQEEVGRHLYAFTAQLDPTYGS